MYFIQFYFEFHAFPSKINCPDNTDDFTERGESAYIRLYSKMGKISYYLSHFDVTDSNIIQGVYPCILLLLFLSSEVGIDVHGHLSWSEGEIHNQLVFGYFPFQVVTYNMHLICYNIYGIQSE